MVCRRGQTAIRPAAQNQRYLVVLRQLIRYIVGRFDPRHPGMVVVKFPSRQPAVGRDAAFDFDHTRGAEVCPGELLFACPNNFYGLSRRARQSCGLHSRVAGMLPSVGCPRVGNDDPNVALRHMKNARQFVAIRKRPLRSGPYRQLAIGKLRHRCPRLGRTVRDIRHVVGRIESMRRGSEAFCYGTFLPSEPLV